MSVSSPTTTSARWVTNEVLVYEGQTIKFCCKPCEKKFLKNPAKYLEKLAPRRSNPPLRRFETSAYTCSQIAMPTV
jgi:YHS domain-containing protein